MSQSPLLDQLGIAARFDHVGLAVRSLREALPFYLHTLGGNLRHGGDNPRVGFRAIAIRYPGADVELMEPLGTSGTFVDFMARRGPGMHHVTFTVDDFEEALKVVSAAHEVTGVHADSADRKEFFVRPSELQQTLVQIVWARPGYLEDRDYTVEDILAGRGIGGTGVSSP